MYKPSEYARILRASLVLTQRAIATPKEYPVAALAADLRGFQENSVRPNAPLVEGMWFEFDVASAVEKLAEVLDPEDPASTGDIELVHQELRFIADRLDMAATEMGMRAESETLRHVRLNMFEYVSSEKVVNVYGEQPLV